MVTCMDEKLILLSDGTLVAMTLNAGCDPEWIKVGCQVCHIKILKNDNNVILCPMYTQCKALQKRHTRIRTK